MFTFARPARALARVLSPARCLVCGKPLTTPRTGCTSCQKLLPRASRARDPELCPRCALPSANGLHCGRCLTRPPEFDATVAAYWFEPPIDRIVRGLKFRERLAAGPALGASLADAVVASVPDDSTQPCVIIPVPLGAVRQRERGFNQATEIARGVGRALRIPVAPGAVRRARNTDAQTVTPATERARNVRNAFSCESVLAGHVAIVDDVMTSAATANAVAAVCRRAGAERVSVWVVARVCT